MQSADPNFFNFKNGEKIKHLKKIGYDITHFLIEVVVPLLQELYSALS